MREQLVKAEELNESNEEQKLPFLFPLCRAVQDTERKVIREALLKTKGNKRRAASLLEIDYKTLLKKARAYNLYNFGIMPQD